MSRDLQLRRRLLDLSLSGDALVVTDEDVRGAWSRSRQLSELAFTLEQLGLRGRGDGPLEVQLTGQGIAAQLGGHWLRLSPEQVERWDGANWVEARAQDLLEAAPQGPAPLSRAERRALLPGRDLIRAGAWLPMSLYPLIVVTILQWAPVPWSEGARLAVRAFLMDPAFLWSGPLMMLPLVSAAVSLGALGRVDMTAGRAQRRLSARAQTFGAAWNAQPPGEPPAPWSVRLLGLQITAQAASRDQVQERALEPAEQAR